VLRDGLEGMLWAGSEDERTLAEIREADVGGMASNGRELLGKHYEKDHPTYEEIEGLDLTVMRKSSETVASEELSRRRRALLSSASSRAYRASSRCVRCSSHAPDRPEWHHADRVRYTMATGWRAWGWNVRRGPRVTFCEAVVWERNDCAS